MRLDALYRKALLISGRVVGLSIVAMAILITVDALLRYLGVSTWVWQVEVVEYVLYLGAFAGAPWVLRERAHIVVDVLLILLPRVARHYVELVADIIGLVISGVLCYYGALVTIKSYGLNRMIFKNLVVEEWLLLSAIPFAFALLALEFIFRLIRRAKYGASEVEVVRVREGL